MTHDTTHGATLVNFGRPAGACAALAFALMLPAAATAAAPRAGQPQGTQAQAAAPDEDFEHGKRLLAQGDAKGAADALKRASRRSKTDAEVWYHLGLAHARQRKNKDARKSFETALKLRPGWADAHAGLAFALVSLNRVADAERAAHRALDSDPKHAGARYVVGLARFSEEKFGEALAEAEAALAASPDFPAAARLAADAVVNAYFEESARQGRSHPTPLGASEAERREYQSLREPALAPFRARMRELAGRLEAFASARPNDPEAGGWRDQAGTLRHYGRPPAEREAADLALASDGVTKKAVITFKPEPGYTEEARRENISGVVRLRAVLMPDGKVRHVVPIRSLPGGLTEKAVAAARKIRFEPAYAGGHPVAQYVVIEYSFNIY